ncbi:HD-GYP domain-containing protein [Pontibacillus salicampi]|uniref:HD-GYP domain-containing protein n=1 Tax=Pontibacillus salicampi TaxID=1449801 RepID=A0ABV6LU60_9BACI
MKVHPKQLEVGCMIIQDVMGKTNQPIIPKNTVVKPIHIEVLQKFLVEEVEISHKRADGDSFLPNHEIEEEQINEERAASTINSYFSDHYLDAVQHYKAMFKHWQAGSLVDITKVREVIVPLIEEALINKSEVFMLHHFSSKSDYFYHHSVAVALLSSIVADKLGYSHGEVIQIGLTGFLSDCGMAKIENHILTKKGALTNDEFEEVKKHPTYSYRLLEHIPVLKKGVLLGVLQHHERMDGSGYPIGLHDAKLHPFGKIVAATDMYHAMTSERLYRSKQSPFKVLEELMSDQFGKFDHTIVQAFINSMVTFTTGTLVRLSNNDIGEIIFMEGSLPTRPMIKLQSDNAIIHLKEHPTLYIEEMVTL